MKELKAEMTKLEKRTTETEGRISKIEDNGRRYENAIRHLLCREVDLKARCEDLQNRFVDYSVKHAVLRQAWSQKQVMYETEPVRVDEREQMERELSQDRWSNTGGKRGKDPAGLTGADVRAFFSGAE
ncbi:hypothetical protein AOLI_G00240780 [Acnodon oligacanthus]